MGALTARQETALVETQRAFAKDMKKYEAVLPSHVPVDRFLRVVVTALTMKPDLLQAPRETILNECLRCASDGLMPDGREAALVPRYGREFSLAYQPMIAGIKKKVRNSGEVSTWDVVAVRDNDTFEFGYGLEPFLRHSYDIRKPRGETIAFYSVATLKDGTKSFDIMSVEDVNRIRDRSDAYKAFLAKKIRSTPWDTDYEEMGKKTVARRHSKDLPSSSDLDRLLYQGEAERGPVDYGDIAATAGQPRSLGQRLDAIADANGQGTGETIDQETGEISGGEAETEDTGEETPGDRGGPSDADLKAARDAGRKHAEDGKPRRQMPKSYREVDALAEAWSEGFEVGSKEAKPK